jgi:hypothetical protein
VITVGNIGDHKSEEGILDISDSRPSIIPDQHSLDRIRIAVPLSEAEIDGKFFSAIIS